MGENATPRRELVRRLLIVLCAAALIVSGGFIIDDLYQRFRTERLDDDVRQLYPGSSWLPWGLMASARAEDVPEPTLPPLQEDFVQLYETNSHVIGWLKAGESIDHPVVQFNNEYYLTHNFYGREDSNGTLFLNEANTLFPRDDVLLIHGHNMRARTMFGTLMKYESYDYLCQYPLISFRTIYDSQEVWYVPIAAFNASMIPGEKGYFDITGIRFDEDVQEGGERVAYQAYLDALRERSLWMSPVDVTTDDPLLMLVTCSYRNEDGRFMLVCRMLREAETADAVAAAFTQE